MTLAAVFLGLGAVVLLGYGAVCLFGDALAWWARRTALPGDERFDAIAERDLREWRERV